MNTKLVTAISELGVINKYNKKQLEEYKQFKKLLEYFVAHLEWINSENKNSKGYDEYIKPLPTDLCTQLAMNELESR